MEWRDQGIVLSRRKHGETSVIIEVFTKDHGRHAGVVRGGTSRRKTPFLQPGAQIDLTWRARLEDHVGSFTVEPLRSRGAALADRQALRGLNAVTALLGFCLPEREPHGRLYHSSVALLDLLDDRVLWPWAYLQWELALLGEMGFGLDLGVCAVSGSNDQLIYVSPRTGRAVSASAAGKWADRLLPLPDCLRGEKNVPDRQIAEGFRTTGHFLHQHLAQGLHKPLPEARERYVEGFVRAAGC